MIKELKEILRNNNEKFLDDQDVLEIAQKIVQSIPPAVKSEYPEDVIEAAIKHAPSYYFDWSGLAAKPKILTLYHGTIYYFDKIDVTKGRSYKDFGRGFYTTRVEQHAINIALRNKRIEVERNVSKGNRDTIAAFVYTFELDMRDILEFKVKEFKEPSKDWVRFIILNREAHTLVHDYDIITGATANDDTRTSIQNILAIAGGKSLSDRALDALILLLEPGNLPAQTYFGTQRAANALKLKDRRIVG